MLLYLTFIIAFYTNLADTKRIDIRSKNESISFKVNCKNIKCPAVRDPVCVKIKNANEKSKNFTYIIAINKCEIKYAKCRQGIDAIVVPMEKCQHVAAGGKRFGKKRMIRQASDSGEVSPVALGQDDSNDDDKDAKKNRAKSSNENDDEDPNEPESDVENPDEPDDDDERNDVQDDDENPDMKDDDDDDDDAAESLDKQDDDDDEDKNDDNDLKEQKLAAYDDDIEDDNEMEPNLIAADYDQQKQEVDYDQYERDCPKVCPAREVMVCARCHHNVYRTFLSTCHLRMFNCKYPNEKLELISRQPCIQSAPFLNDLSEAKGVVSEPGDKDDVLKFIYCRDKGRLGKDDPRCNFKES